MYVNDVNWLSMSGSKNPLLLLLHVLPELVFPRRKVW